MMNLGDPASLIEFNNMRFVITYMPDKICTRQYIKDLQQYNTRKLIKVCDCAYSLDMFNAIGITVEELIFPDGSFPQPDIIEQWLSIVKHHFQALPKSALAVHCRSGLGRSAVLVAIAIIECGLKPQEAIEFIRQKRRGAFNASQVEEIMKYKSKDRFVEKKLFGGIFGRKTSEMSVKECAEKPSDTVLANILQMYSRLKVSRMKQNHK